MKEHQLRPSQQLETLARKASRSQSRSNANWGLPLHQQSSVPTEPIVLYQQKLDIYAPCPRSLDLNTQELRLA